MEEIDDLEEENPKVDTKPKDADIEKIIKDAMVGVKELEEDIEVPIEDDLDEGVDKTEDIPIWIKGPASSAKAAFLGFTSIALTPVATSEVRNKVQIAEFFVSSSRFNLN